MARGLGYDLVPLGECLGDPPVNWYRDPATGAPRDVRDAVPPAPAPIPAPAPVSPPGTTPYTPLQPSSPSSSTTGGGGSLGATRISATSKLASATPTAVSDVNFGHNMTASTGLPVASPTPAPSSSAALAPVRLTAGKHYYGAGFLCWLIAMG
jgi:hypothetical protein